MALSPSQMAVWDARLNESMQANQTPVESVQRDRVEYVSFYPHFKQLCEKLLKRQESLWRVKYMEGLRNALYYNRRQILVPRSGFGYDIKQLRGVDHPIYVYNRLRPYSDEVTAMWVQSSPEILHAVLDEDDRKAARAQDQIETLDQYFNYNHLTEETLQKIAKGGQFCGNYHYETWFDKDVRNGFEWLEEYSPVNLPSSMWYGCLECGNSGEMLEYAKCENCGSTLLEPYQMPGVNFDAKTGEGWKQVGEVCVRPFPSWSLRYSLTTGPADSPWRYAEEDQPRELVEANFGKLDGTADDSKWGQDELMHAERVMRRSDRQSGGWNEEDDLNDVLTQRFWFEPEMLHYVGLKENATLPDGTVLEQGIRLSEAFPQGMCILTCPGLPKFLNVYPESHKERFVDGKYGLTFGQNVGHGIEDGVESQRQENLLRSGIFRYLQKTLQPSIAVNNRVFPDARLFNRLDGVISANNATIPEGTTIGQHWSMISAPPVNPQIFNVIEKLEADMQAALKAYNSGGDYPGIQKETATAVRYGAAKAASAHNISLALYAGVLKELSLRRLTLAQKHYQNLRLVHSIDRLSGERKSKIIKAVDIRCSFMAWVKTGSFMPNLEIEKRAAHLEGLNAVAMLQKLNLSNATSIRKVNELFHTDFTFERQREKIDQCDEALDMMMEAVGAYPEAMPEELYALSPVDPYGLGHETKIQWWREWRDSNEGRRAPEAVRQAAIMNIEAHYAALLNEKQYIAMAAAVGQGLLTSTGQPLLPDNQSVPDQSEQIQTETAPAQLNNNPIAGGSYGSIQ